MSKKIIRVPKGWPISYCDMDAKTQKVTLTANKEYRIGINNDAKIYPIITIASVQKNADKQDVIVPKLQIDPGYMNPIHTPTCGNIPVAEITSIEEVSTGYVSERRTKKTMNVAGKTPCTFAFDKKNGGEYRISVYSGEMVALSVKDDRPNAKGNTRNLYCTFVDFDEIKNELIVTRYGATNGVRQITEDYRVRLDNLFAIFRYTLVEKTEDADKKAEEPADAKEPETTPEPATDGAAENPAE